MYSSDRQQVHQDEEGCVAVTDSLQRRGLYRRYPPRHQSRPQRPLSFPAARAIPGRDFTGRDFPGGESVESVHTSSARKEAGMPALTYDFHMRQLEDFIEEYKVLQKQVRASERTVPKGRPNSCLHHVTPSLSQSQNSSSIHFWYPYRSRCRHHLCTAPLPHSVTNDLQSAINLLAR